MSALGKYFRKHQHRKYVEEMVTVMRGRVCKQAVLYGVVDKNTRRLYLKYNEYLKRLDNEYGKKNGNEN
jgi:hypothetical protein